LEEAGVAAILGGGVSWLVGCWCFFKKKSFFVNFFFFQKGFCCQRVVTEHIFSGHLSWKKNI
jgi:hypothetical protein